MAPGGNEAFSRVVIDALLEDVGWKLTDGRSVRYEYPLSDGTRADYVLCDRHGRALAVVEAKRSASTRRRRRRRPRAYAEQLKVPLRLSRQRRGNPVLGVAERSASRGRSKPSFRRTILNAARRPARSGATRLPIPIDTQDRRARLPDRVHRHPLPRDQARPAQAARRDGDRHRQDPHGGRLHQAAVRGQRRHPRALSRRPHSARQADRGRFRRASAGLSRPTSCGPGAASRTRSASPSPRCRAWSTSTATTRRATSIS